MHNITCICFCMLVVASVFSPMSSATDIDVIGVVASIVVAPSPPHHVEQTTPKEEGGKRKKRSISSIDATNIVNKMNSLRSSVEASDMNYLIYSSLIEKIATNWTSYCNFNGDVYVPDDVGLYVIKSAYQHGYPPDPVSLLGTAFIDSKFYYALRSVYLQYVGADYTYCSNAQVRNQSLAGVYLSAYLFSFSSSNFNDSQRQYTLGEQCTTCLSGSYWCYEGLCKDDCSASDSNCYCNSYCLNCAATDSTTCRCLCLNGWIGSRCENANGVNTTPTCSTTPRIPRTSTTTSTTSTTKGTTSKSIDAATRSSTSGSSIGKSMFRLAFYAAVALLSKICTVFI